APDEDRVQLVTAEIELLAEVTAQVPPHAGVLGESLRTLPRDRRQFGDTAAAGLVGAHRLSSHVSRTTCTNRRVVRARRGTPTNAVTRASSAPSSSTSTWPRMASTSTRPTHAR